MESLTEENLAGPQLLISLQGLSFLTQIQKVNSADLGVGCGKMILTYGREGGETF